VFVRKNVYKTLKVGEKAFNSNFKEYSRSTDTNDESSAEKVEYIDETL